MLIKYIVNQVSIDEREKTTTQHSTSAKRKGRRHLISRGKKYFTSFLYLSMLFLQAEKVDHWERKQRNLEVSEEQSMRVGFTLKCSTTERFFYLSVKLNPLACRKKEKKNKNAERERKDILNVDSGSEPRTAVFPFRYC